MKRVLLIFALVLGLTSAAFSGADTRAKWESTGSMSTEEFSAFSVWKIHWNLTATENGVSWIAVSVYDARTGNVVDTASAGRPGEGVSMIHSSGRFYLSISVVGSAKVWVE